MDMNHGKESTISEKTFEHSVHVSSQCFAVRQQNLGQSLSWKNSAPSYLRGVKLYQSQHYITNWCVLFTEQYATDKVK